MVSDSRPGAALAEPGVSAASGVPHGVEVLAAWSWRLLAIGALLYFLLLKVVGRFPLVVVPMLAALLISALMYPVTRWLRRHRCNRGAASGLTMLLAVLVLGGIGTFVVQRAANQYPQFVAEVSQLVRNAEHWLTTGPLQLNPDSVNNIGGRVTDYLRGRQSQVASGVVSAVGTIVEIGTGTILTIFLTFFFLYDGDRMFAWFSGFFPARHRPQVHAAGNEVWRTLTGYVGGTFIVALTHALILGVALGVTRVQLVAPLVLLIFVGSFIPIIGMPIFGGLAVLVALISRGGLVAVIILVVLVVSNQLESHLLQPIVVGRYVHLHPMVIAIVLAGGAVFAGLPGAIFGVPAVASVNAAVRGASRWRRDNLSGPADDGLEGADAALRRHDLAHGGPATAPGSRQDEIGATPLSAAGPASPGGSSDTRV